MPEIGLSAILALDADQVADVRSLAIRVVIRNIGAIPISLYVLPLPYAPTVLDVVDKAGRPVATVPPSMPPPPDTSGDYHILVSGASECFVYRGSSLFSDPLPNGQYAIRFRLEGDEEADSLDSGWVSFTVAK